MNNIFNYNLYAKSRGRRNGFSHDASLYLCISGKSYNFENTVHYYNRTWEPYQYYTAKCGCVDKAKRFFIEKIKDQVRNETGKTLRAKIAKNLLADYLKNSTELCALNEIYNRLKARKW